MAGSFPVQLKAYGICLSIWHANALVNHLIINQRNGTARIFKHFAMTRPFE
jgi:hypothetical protein